MSLCYKNLQHQLHILDRDEDIFEGTNLSVTLSLGTLHAIIIIYVTIISSNFQIKCC